MLSIRNKFSNLSVLLPSLLVLLTLLLVHVNPVWFYVSAAAALLTAAILFWRRSHKPAQLILPVIYLLGIFGLAAAAPLAGTIFGLLAAYLLSHYYRFFQHAVPEYLEQTVTLFTAFLLSAFMWSVNYYFSPPWWTILAAASAGFGFLFWQTFYKIGGDGPVFLASMISTLVVVETTWVLLFWPLHFLSLAAVILAVFYLIYMLSSSYFTGRLNRRKVYFQVSLVSIFLFIILLSSPWQPAASL